MLWHLLYFCLEEAQEKLQPLNIYKSIGPYLHHPRILRTLEDRLVGPVTHIFKNSVESGIISEECKSVNVTGIHKKEVDKNMEIIGL